MMLTRRDLLSAGLAGAAIGALGRAPRAAYAEARTLPSDGLTLPAVGLGTWITFNVGADPVLLARSVDVMRAFFEEGGGMIDSSPMYGRWACPGRRLRARLAG